VGRTASGQDRGRECREDEGYARIVGVARWREVQPMSRAEAVRVAEAIYRTSEAAIVELLLLATNGERVEGYKAIGSHRGAQVHVVRLVPRDPLESCEALRRRRA
jgi:hypothetical protein